MISDPIFKKNGDDYVSIGFSDLKSDNRYYLKKENIDGSIDYMELGINPKISDPIFKKNGDDYVPIGFSDLKSDNEYYIYLNTSSLKDFKETLTISVKSTFVLQEDYETDYSVYLGKGSELQLINCSKSGDKYNLDCIIKTLSNYTTDSSLSEGDHITIIVHGVDLRLNTFTIDVVSFKLFQMEFKNVNNDTLIKFPKADPNDEASYDTKLDRGHLWTEKQDTVLLKGKAPYKNINIINTLKPLQFDIINEIEGN